MPNRSTPTDAPPVVTFLGIDIEAIQTGLEGLANILESFKERFGGKQLTFNLDIDTKGIKDAKKSIESVTKATNELASGVQSNAAKAEVALRLLGTAATSVAGTIKTAFKDVITEQEAQILRLEQRARAISEPTTSRTRRRKIDRDIQESTILASAGASDVLQRRLAAQKIAETNARISTDQQSRIQSNNVNVGASRGVVVNDAGRRVVNDAINQIVGGENQNIFGRALGETIARQLVASLRGRAENISRNPSAAQSLEVLAARIERSIVPGRGTAISVDNLPANLRAQGYTARQVFQEELTHLSQNAAANRSLRFNPNGAAAVGEVYDSVKNLPGFKKAETYLTRQGYDINNQSTALNEVTAKIISGQGKQLGISKQEGNEVLKNYFDRFAKTYGAETLTEFDSLPRNVQAYRNVAVLNNQNTIRDEQVRQQTLAQIQLDIQNTVKAVSNYDAAVHTHLTSIANQIQSATIKISDLPDPPKELVDNINKFRKASPRTENYLYNTKGADNKTIKTQEQLILSELESFGKDLSPDQQKDVFAAIQSMRQQIIKQQVENEKLRAKAKEISDIERRTRTSPAEKKAATETAAKAIEQEERNVTAQSLEEKRKKFTETKARGQAALDAINRPAPNSGVEFRTQADTDRVRERAGIPAAGEATRAIKDAADLVKQGFQGELGDITIEQSLIKKKNAVLQKIIDTLETILTKLLDEEKQGLGISLTQNVNVKNAVKNAKSGSAGTATTGPQAATNIASSIGNDETLDQFSNRIKNSTRKVIAQSDTLDQAINAFSEVFPTLTQNVKEFQGRLTSVNALGTATARNQGFDDILKELQGQKGNLTARKTQVGIRIEETRRQKALAAIDGDEDNILAADARIASLASEYKELTAAIQFNNHIKELAAAQSRNNKDAYLQEAKAAEQSRKAANTTSGKSRADNLIENAANDNFANFNRFDELNNLGRSLSRSGGGPVGNFIRRSADRLKRIDASGASPDQQLSEVKELQARSQSAATALENRIIKIRESQKNLAPDDINGREKSNAELERTRANLSGISQLQKELNLEVKRFNQALKEQQELSKVNLRKDAISNNNTILKGFLTGTRLGNAESILDLGVAFNNSGSSGVGGALSKAGNVLRNAATGVGNAPDQLIDLTNSRDETARFANQGKAVLLNLNKQLKESTDPQLQAQLKAQIEQTTVAVNVLIQAERVLGNEIKIVTKEANAFNEAAKKGNQAAGRTALDRELGARFSGGAFLGFDSINSVIETGNTISGAEGLGTVGSAISNIGGRIGAIKAGGTTTTDQLDQLKLQAVEADKTRKTLQEIEIKQKAILVSTTATSIEREKARGTIDAIDLGLRGVSVLEREINAQQKILNERLKLENETRLASQRAIGATSGIGNASNLGTSGSSQADALRTLGNQFNTLGATTVGGTITGTGSIIDRIRGGNEDSATLLRDVTSQKNEVKRLLGEISSIEAGIASEIAENPNDKDRLAKLNTELKFTQVTKQALITTDRQLAEEEKLLSKQLQVATTEAKEQSNVFNELKSRANIGVVGAEETKRDPKFSTPIIGGIRRTLREGQLNKEIASLSQAYVNFTRDLEVSNKAINRQAELVSKLENEIEDLENALAAASSAGSPTGAIEGRLNFARNRLAGEQGTSRRLLNSDDAIREQLSGARQQITLREKEKQSLDQTGGGFRRAKLSAGLFHEELIAILGTSRFLPGQLGQVLSGVSLLGGGFKTVGGAIAGTTGLVIAGIAQFLSLGAKFNEEVNALRAQAEGLGITASTAKALTITLQQSGGSIENFSVGIKKIGEAIAGIGPDARRTGELLRLALGPDFVLEGKTSTEVLLQLSKALESNTLRASGLANVIAGGIFGRSFDEVQGRLSDINRQFDENLRIVEESGLTSEEAQKNAQEYARSLALLGVEFDKFVQKARAPIAATIAIKIVGNLFDKPNEFLSTFYDNLVKQVKNIFSKDIQLSDFLLSKTIADTLIDINNQDAGLAKQRRQEKEKKDAEQAVKDAGKQRLIAEKEANKIQAEIDALSPGERVVFDRGIKAGPIDAALKAKRASISQQLSNLETAESGIKSLQETLSKNIENGAASEILDAGKKAIEDQSRSIEQIRKALTLLQGQEKLLEEQLKTANGERTEIQKENEKDFDQLFKNQQEASKEFLDDLTEARRLEEARLQDSVDAGTLSFGEGFGKRIALAIKTLKVFREQQTALGSLIDQRIQELSERGASDPKALDEVRSLEQEKNKLTRASSKEEVKVQQEVLGLAKEFRQQSIDLANRFDSIELSNIKSHNQRRLALIEAGIGESVAAKRLEIEEKARLQEEEIQAEINVTVRLLEARRKTVISQVSDSSGIKELLATIPDITKVSQEQALALINNIRSSSGNNEATSQLLDALEKLLSLENALADVKQNRTLELIKLQGEEQRKILDYKRSELELDKALLDLREQELGILQEANAITPLEYEAERLQVQKDRLRLLEQEAAIIRQEAQAQAEKIGQQIGLQRAGLIASNEKNAEGIVQKSLEEALKSGDVQKLVASYAQLNGQIRLANQAIRLSSSVFATIIKSLDPVIESASNLREPFNKLSDVFKGVQQILNAFQQRNVKRERPIDEVARDAGKNLETSVFNSSDVLQTAFKVSTELLTQTVSKAASVGTVDLTGATKELKEARGELIDTSREVAKGVREAGVNLYDSLAEIINNEVARPFDQVALASGNLVDGFGTALDNLQRKFAVDTGKDTSPQSVNLNEPQIGSRRQTLIATEKFQEKIDEFKAREPEKAAAVEGVVRRTGLPSAVIFSLLNRESSFGANLFGRNPDGSLSGAVGATQTTGRTARGIIANHPEEFKDFVLPDFVGTKRVLTPEDAKNGIRDDRLDFFKSLRLFEFHIKDILADPNVKGDLNSALLVYANGIQRFLEYIKTNNISNASRTELNQLRNYAPNILRDVVVGEERNIPDNLPKTAVERILTKSEFDSAVSKLLDIAYETKRINPVPNGFVVLDKDLVPRILEKNTGKVLELEDAQVQALYKAIRDGVVEGVKIGSKGNFELTPFIDRKNQSRILSNNTLLEQVDTEQEVEKRLKDLPSTIIDKIVRQNPKSEVVVTADTASKGLVITFNKKLQADDYSTIVGIIVNSIKEAGFRDANKIPFNIKPRVEIAELTTRAFSLADYSGQNTVPPIVATPRKPDVFTIPLAQLARSLTTLGIGADKLIDLSPPKETKQPVFELTPKVELFVDNIKKASTELNDLGTKTESLGEIITNYAAQIEQAINSLSNAPTLIPIKPEEEPPRPIASAFISDPLDSQLGGITTDIQTQGAEVKQKSRSFWSKLLGVFNVLDGEAKQNTPLATRAVQGVFNAVSQALTGAFSNSLSGKISGFGNAAGSLISIFKPVLGGFVGGLASTLGGIVDLIGSIFRRRAENIANATNTKVQQILDKFNQGEANIGETIKNLQDTLEAARGQLTKGKIGKKGGRSIFAQLEKEIGSQIQSLRAKQKEIQSSFFDALELLRQPKEVRSLVTSARDAFAKVREFLNSFDSKAEALAHIGDAQEFLNRTFGETRQELTDQLKDLTKQEQDALREFIKSRDSIINQGRITTGFEDARDKLIQLFELEKNRADEVKKRAEERTKIENQLSFLDTIFARADKIIDRMRDAFSGVVNGLDAIFNGNGRVTSKALADAAANVGRIAENTATQNLTTSQSSSNVILGSFSVDVTANSPEQAGTQVANQIEKRLRKLGLVKKTAGLYNPDRPYSS